MPGIKQSRQLNAVLQHQKRVSWDDHRRNCCPPLNSRTTWNSAKILCDEFLRGGWIKITSNRERRVVWRVIRLEKILNVRKRSRAQVGHRADDWPGVGVSLRIKRRK